MSAHSKLMAALESAATDSHQNVSSNLMQILQLYDEYKAEIEAGRGPLVLEQVEWDDVAVGERVYEKYPGSLIPTCKHQNPVHGNPVPKHTCYKLPEVSDGLR